MENLFKGMEITIHSSRFHTFDEVMLIGRFHEVDKNIKTYHSERIFHFESGDEISKKICPYFEGRHQRIPGFENNGMQEYFAERGYRFIKDPYPWVLIHAMGFLNEQKLSEMGLKINTDIVLPTPENFLFINPTTKLSSFLRGSRGIRTDGVSRELLYLNTDGEFSQHFLFLLELI